MLNKNNNNIIEIKVCDIEYLVSQYADDTSLILDGSEQSFLNTMKVLKSYADVSGMCIHVDKTRAVWIVSMRNSGLVMCPDFNVKWDNVPFTLLGVTLSVN